MESVAPQITVVVPTYNERENLPKLVDRLAALKIPNLHVLVVDDNSPDGTGEVADKLGIDGPI
ncbi:glycosyltransferase, partial [Klebsiella pneumoniae]